MYHNRPLNKVLSDQAGISLPPSISWTGAVSTSFIFISTKIAGLMGIAGLYNSTSPNLDCDLGISGSCLT